jgi:CrcB protein
VSFSRPAADIWAVVVGGVIGTGLRYGIDVAFPVADPGFPWPTLAINVVGSFALALLTATLWLRSSTPSWVKAGIGTGLMGSFTTFSAFAVSLFSEATEGRWLTLVLYLVGSLVLGFGATVLAFRIARRHTPESAPVNP